MDSELVQRIVSMRTKTQSRRLSKYDKGGKTQKVSRYFRMVYTDVWLPNEAETIQLSLNKFIATFPAPPLVEPHGYVSLAEGLYIAVIHPRKRIPNAFLLCDLSTGYSTTKATMNVEEIKQWLNHNKVSFQYWGGYGD
jgi:hypothetical protein